jgi:DNA-binding NarL/FixJ family response regulator
MVMAKRLLVVDDEPNLLRAVEFVLRGEGFDVVTVRSGNEALVAVARNLPDLIVSDVRMPTMDGYALARRLRSSPHSAIVPIVFLTAKDETEDRVEGFRSGADVYLTKPFEPEELIAVVRGVLQRVEQSLSRIARLFSDKPWDENVFVGDELSASECQVAAAVARGLSNKEIAHALHLSVRTIENHVSHILSKKRFSNRVEIARYIISQNPV